MAIGQTPLQVEAGRADQSIDFRKTEGEEFRFLRNICVDTTGKSVIRGFPVECVEQSETHRRLGRPLMGFASLNPVLRAHHESLRQCFYSDKRDHLGELTFLNPDSEYLFYFR